MLLEKFLKLFRVRARKIKEKGISNLQKLGFLEFIQLVP